MIPCPFHKDSNPSLIITLVPDSKFAIGSWKCFGCGKAGRWNTLADKLGLRRTSQYDHELSEFAGLAMNDDELLGDSITLDTLAQQLRIEFMLEWGSDEWRGNPPELMRALGAREGLNDKGHRVALLPVYVSGELQGGIAALFKRGSDGDLSYVSSPGPWVQTHGLFPYDYAKRMCADSGMDAMAITEGPRDALRLIRSGIPAVGILGSQNWSSTKRGLLLSVVSTPVIVMDGDTAGRVATQAIKESFRDIGIEPVSINLSALAERLNRKVDPANMPISSLRIMRDKYFRVDKKIGAGR